MRVLLACLGTTGDLLPYLGLADRLAARGDAVTVATHAQYADHVDRADAGRGRIAHHALPPDPWGDLGTGLAQRIRTGGLPGLRGLHRLFAPWLPLMVRSLDAAVPGHDVAVASTLAWSVHHSAEAAGVPSVDVPLQPLHPTSAWPPLLLTTRSLGPWLNREMGQQVQQAMWRLWLDEVTELRVGHGLPPLTASAWFEQRERRQVPVWHAVSPTVVPRPADWRDGVEVTGYLWPPSQGAVPEAVEEFLAAGPPPVLVAFGSSPVDDPARLAATLTGAGRRAGVRLLVQAGWGGLAPEGDDVLGVGHLDHPSVMPRCAGVVHHAGAGTTAATIRAGVPGVPVPANVDQPFWARRTAELGVSTRPLPARQLVAQTLAERLAVLSDPGLRARSAAVGEEVRAEDGAAALLERLDCLADSRTGRGAP